ncbi:MAG TPA: TatD family hydrolase [Candidatus Limnocylindrales bacterium]|nr:TatD family hydrolase [Candidatus Limnocylindrales bacterium]
MASARTTGVERMLVPGWDLESSRMSVELARRAGVGASAGIHPHVASEQGESAWHAVAAMVSLPHVVAVGETGLDYDRGFSPRDAQLANLRWHLGLARDSGKPAILHCRSKPGERDAQDDLIRELAEAGGPPALLHSFSGPVDYAERALEMGLYVSFSGLAFRDGEEVTADVACLVPADRLLVETDSPYLSPPGAPRRRNTPEWVRVTAAWLAQQRGTTLDELGPQLVSNYDRLFTKSESAPDPRG